MPRTKIIKCSTLCTLLAVWVSFGLGGCTSVRSDDASNPQDASKILKIAPPNISVTARSQPPRENISPFTGLPVSRDAIFATKVDNVSFARPQTGLEQADIVYVEQVEGGLSRFLCIYSSQLPDKVGPVRSARESDLDLLQQFGKPALIYSGSRKSLIPVIRNANLLTITPDTHPDIFHRDNSREAPHNLYANLRQVESTASKVSGSRDIGFRFGEAPSGGGTPMQSRTVKYPEARFDFTWDDKIKKWKVYFDSERGGAKIMAIAVPNVVIQHVTFKKSLFADKWGSVSPYINTVGEGLVEILRDGKSFLGKWSRKSASDVTVYKGASGDVLKFARGPVWVVLTAD
ncbi:DUF3048 domain-containing protein (plasmid) [Streptomyces sp. JL4002]|uniref:DUF3048 domain-containing protein n=1 Tax=Streptomyces sp. JL4002 TaxID=3404781 RepID=UPI003B28A70E